MRDENRSGALQQQILEERDAVDVEMIGRLIEEQQVGLARERERQCGPFALATRRRASDAWAPIETEAVQILDELRLQAPTFAFVVNLVELAADHEALAQRWCGRQLRLLLDQHDLRPSWRLTAPSSSAHDRR